MKETLVILNIEIITKTICKEPKRKYCMYDVVVAVAAENITEVISRNVAELTVLGRIKIRVRSGYLDPTVVGTVMHNVENNNRKQKLCH